MNIAVVAAFAVVGSSLSLSSHAWAVTKAACIEAHSAAQVDRREGRLQAAKEKLVTCAADGCPSVIRGECGELLAEVSRDLPTVVLSAKDASGKELTQVTVRDGATTIATDLSGKAITLDPGQHHFVATLASGESAQLDAVVRTGDRNLPVGLVFTTVGAPPAPPTRDTTSDRPPATEKSRPIPGIAWAAGGVAVVGAGVFLGFALGGKAKERAFDSCKPYCAGSDYDDMKRSYLIADIALGTSIVAASVMAIVILTRPEVEVPKKEAGLFVSPWLGQATGGAAVSGRF